MVGIEGLGFRKKGFSLGRGISDHHWQQAASRIIIHSRKTVPHQKQYRTY
jgi:hypothetical protein